MQKLLNLLPRWRGKNVVTIAGETFTPEPLGLEDTVRLVLLLSPYLPLIEEFQLEFKQALTDTSGSRPRLLSAFMKALADQIAHEDLSTAFVILLGWPIEKLATVKAVELIGALPVLDDINDFHGLFLAVRELGAFRYDRPN
jgi:hypothetical protein